MYLSTILICQKPFSTSNGRIKKVRICLIFFFPYRCFMANCLPFWWIYDILFNYSQSLWLLQRLFFCPNRQEYFSFLQIKEMEKNPLHAKCYDNKKNIKMNVINSLNNSWNEKCCCIYKWKFCLIILKTILSISRNNNN